MKHIIFCLFVVLLAACSQQEENKTQSTAPKTEVLAPTVENAKATLEVSKQIEQTTLNAAEQQKKTIEETEGQ